MMGDDFDIRTLPANFVSISKPSKVIERLIERRKCAHNEAVEEMKDKMKDVNIKIEKEIQSMSTILKDKLKGIKINMETSLFILEQTTQNDIKLEDRPLEATNRDIIKTNDTRRKAVDEFYSQLVGLDKQRTEQFKLILNETYTKLVGISYELPFKLEEFFGNEILIINQLTVNNFQSYAELQSELQLQIENDTRVWIQMLSEIKERVKKYHEGVAKDMMSKSRHSLDQSLTELFGEGHIAKEFQDFDMMQMELENQLEKMKTIPVDLAVVEKWLKKTRTTLAGLDQSARNIVSIYKSTIVIIFNRFFEELDNIKQFLVHSGIVDGLDVEDFQKEFYTPGVEELNLKFQYDFEELKNLWNDVINSMRESVEETSSFLRDSAFLFDLHFHRLEDARRLVKREVKNVAHKNNLNAEITEGKLNILIDKLRQGPTERKLDKSLLDVKKSLDNIQKLYNSHTLLEIKVVQKFKVMVNSEVDVLVSELLRFLAHYPPDEGHDPKIQRRRASQITALTAYSLYDPRDDEIPMQMLFCKFQVEAVKNWQFGLWEAISNYVQVGRAEIMQREEEWIKVQYEKINARLNTKLAFHKPRYKRIICSVYEKRLYELDRHIRRFGSHKTAVEMEVKNLKDMQKVNEQKYNDICTNFNTEAQGIGGKALNSKNSGESRKYDLLLKKCTKNAVESLENVLLENKNLSNKLMEDLKLANMKYTKAMKLFSEGGNFTIDEIKNLLKNFKKLETATAKNLANIQKENIKADIKFRDKLDTDITFMTTSVQELIEEHEYNERSVERIKKLQDDIRGEVIKLKIGTKNLKTPFNDLIEASRDKLGQPEYMEKFFFRLKEIAAQAVEQAYFLLHPEPVVMYSTLAAGPRNSTSDLSKHFQDYTTLLFGAKLPRGKECFVTKLNNLLYNSLQNIQLKAQDFYTKHEEPLLDPSKIQPTYEAFMDEVLEKYRKYLVQCEVSWVENTYDVIVFFNEFLRCKEQYLTTFESKFNNISHGYCSIVLDDISRQLQETREDIKRQLLEVHSKLKALHGHPRNKNLLEEVDAKFKELGKKIEASLKSTLEPHKENLIQEYQRVGDNFIKTNKILKELHKDDGLFQIRSKLNDQLLIKLDLMKLIIECEPDSAKSSKLGELDITISKQVLDYMNTGLSPRTQNDTLMNYSVLESFEESTLNDFQNELEENLETHLQCITDFVEVELVKYYEEFRKAWPQEIETIRSLYEVKYDKKGR